MNQIKYWTISAVLEIFWVFWLLQMFQSGMIENVKKKMLFNPIYWVNVFIKPFFIGDSFFQLLDQVHTFGEQCEWSNF